MSRIRLTVDRLVLNGFQRLEAKALSEALQAELSQVLADKAERSEWARPHRTPVLKLGCRPLEAGTTGAGSFGRRMARAVVRELKP
jgi:hypothetical protein